MAHYVRPEIPDATYVDEDGSPIVYGSRWAGGLPPDEAYSRTSHLERFAPLHSVAAALLDWLLEEYDVESSDDLSAGQDVAVVADGSIPILRAVRLTPADTAAAPLTFVFTEFPGIIVHAGALADHAFPPCGCDACDDDIATVIGDLEWTVNAVVAGSFTERIGEPSSQRVESSLAWEGRSSGGGALPTDLSDDARESARRKLPPDGRWSPWPLRRNLL